MRPSVFDSKQGRLFHDYRYFFYITNDRDSTPLQIVLSAKDRCQQENMIARRTLWYIVAVYGELGYSGILYANSAPWPDWPETPCAELRGVVAGAGVPAG